MKRKAGRHSLLRLAQPFGHQIAARDGYEGGILGLGGHCLGNVGLSSAGWAKQQNAAPWSAFACKIKLCRWFKKNYFSFEHFVECYYIFHNFLHTSPGF
jgi:hypothetical protein